MILVRIEKKRGFQPPWYKVHVYKCEQCNFENRIHEEWVKELLESGKVPVCSYCITKRMRSGTNAPYQVRGS